MSYPAVSVVMAVHNGEPFVVQAIESVLRQTMTDFELITVDDASTDNTPHILQAFRERDPRVIVLRHEQRQERSRSRNHAILAANGKYIAIMDADDISMPLRLERQIEYMEANPSLVLCGVWGYEISPNNRIVGVLQPPVRDRDLRKFMFRANPFVHAGVMFRRDALLRTSLYDPALSQAEDYDLYWRVCKQGDIAVIPEFLVLHRVNWDQEKKSNFRRRLRSVKVHHKWYRAEQAPLSSYVSLFLCLTAAVLPATLVVGIRQLWRKRRTRKHVDDAEVISWLAQLEEYDKQFGEQCASY
jgi:glycosyltransferase involved in cell wall biosynthesis